MDSRILTEIGWKTLAVKFKVKDNGLQKALAAYEKLPDNKQGDRLKAVGALIQLAGSLRKAKEVAGSPPVVKYLADMLAAAEAEKKQIGVEVVAAAKTLAESKKQAAKDKQEAEEAEAGEEEEEQGDYPAKLLAAIQKLKSSKGVAFQCLICDAKPFVAAIIAKKLTPKHKEELAKVSGGSKRFLPPATCQMLEGKLSVSLDKPVAGMARRLQESIKHFTGKKFAVVIGTEAAEGEDEQVVASPPTAPSAAEAAAKAAAAKQAAFVEAAAKAVAAKQAAAAEVAAKAAAAKQAAAERKILEERRRDFKKARASWVAVKNKAEADLEKVKDGARMQYLADADQYPKIAKGCKDIDAILDNLDDELRDTLDQYAATPLSNQAKLHELAASAIEVLDGYRSYVAKDPIMKAIDKKEFANVTVHAPIMKALNDLRKALS